MSLYLGQMQLLPYNYTVVYWERCDGHLLPIKDNEGLFSLIGNIYGGDGTTTFALPDLRNAVPYRFPESCGEPMCAYYICNEGIYPRSEDLSAKG